MIISLILKYWRIAAAVGLGLLLVWWHQHEVTKAYRQGATDREASALHEAASRVEADMAAKTKELDDREAALDMDRERLRGERAALASARSDISAALSGSLKQIAGQGVTIRNEIQDVPDSAVNGRFRLALARARAAEAERASGAAGQPAGK